ncbi:MAG: 5'-deoxynucleotidase, partial [Ruminococcus sp.]|nr:5'-deoxynucleotidase [Ruminococcus sp.]
DIYREIEDKAADRLVSMLPEDFREDYSRALKQNADGDDALRPFVKAADRFSALIICIEEMRMGIDEFRQAAAAIEQSIHDMRLPEAEVFFEEFLPSYHLALDELQAT